MGSHRPRERQLASHCKMAPFMPFAPNVKPKRLFVSFSRGQDRPEAKLLPSNPQQPGYSGEGLGLGQKNDVDDNKDDTDPNRSRGRTSPSVRFLRGQCRRGPGRQCSGRGGGLVSSRMTTTTITPTCDSIRSRS